MNAAPGPYEVVKVEDLPDSKGNRFFMIRNEQGAIATVYPRPDAEGTANLLAAAPDLLEMLKRVRIHTPDEKNLAAPIDSIIARAEGR